MSITDLSAAECYLVLAGSQKEAAEWAIDKGLSRWPRRSNRWLYASSPQAIEGLRDMVVVSIGSFNQRRDATRIRDIVDICIATGFARELETRGRYGS